MMHFMLFLCPFSGIGTLIPSTSYFNFKLNQSEEIIRSFHQRNARCISFEAPVTQIYLVHTVDHKGKDVFNPCPCFRFLPVSLLLTFC